MPPKKTESGAAAPAKKTSSHPSYQDMITDAIISLKERNGSSRQALKKYVKGNNDIKVTDNMFDSIFNKALKSGVDKGVFEQPKGPSGGTKLAKKTAPKKEAEKKPTAEKKTAPKKAAAPKKETATKKAAAPKKATTTAKKAAPAKKPVAKKPAAPKKAAAKKADAPAVTDKPTVLTKTKSGRVAKTTASKPAAKKAAAPKKAAPKKAAAASA